MTTISAPWPPLALDSWRETYRTLHLWTQIVGKTRLGLSPMENHWWNATLYVTSRGLGTSVMPSRRGNLSIEFDFLDHRSGSARATGRAIACTDPQSVAEFYAGTWASCVPRLPRADSADTGRGRPRFRLPRTRSMRRTMRMLSAAGGGRFWPMA